MNQRHLIQSQKGEQEELAIISVKEPVRASWRELGVQRAEWEVWCDGAWWLGLGAVVGASAVLRAWAEWMGQG